MGILRKYLWLVVPIVFFANYASADTCENDPYTCTPTELCSKTTEKIDNVLYWISSEEDKHLKVARKINLNCGAKNAMSSCQKDASKCSILELCKVAATKDVSTTNWNEINPQHVKLAKSFGLDCGVKEVQGINQDNKTNTFISTSNDKTCSQDVMKCTPTELCDAASYTINGITGWKVGAYKKFVDEAKRRNTSCGVKSASNDKTCSQDVTKCTPTELCDAASYTVNKVTEWKQGKYLSFVQEAKRRNISCGVKSASNDQVKDGEKARIASEAEKKRKADEKARLALEAEKKRKADEKARLALEAEKKRKADEKARLALEAEKKRKADEKEELTPKAKSLLEDIMLTNSQYQNHLYDEVTGIFDEKKVTQTTLLMNHYNEMFDQKSPEIMKHFKKLIKATSPEYIEASLNYILFQVEVFKEITTNKFQYSDLMIADIFSDSLGVLFGDSQSLLKQTYVDAYKQAGTNMYNRGSELAIKAKLGFEIAASEGVYQAKYKLEEMNARYLNYVKSSSNARRSVAPANQMQFNPVNIRDPMNLKRYRN